MPLPQINETDIASILPKLENIQFLAEGGQKKVFTCEIEKNLYVLKFLLVDSPLQSLNKNTNEFTMPSLGVVSKIVYCLLVIL